LNDNDADTTKPPDDEVTRVQAVAGVGRLTEASDGLNGPDGPTAPNIPSGLAAPAGTVVGEFELVRVIGEGGFGIVYEATDRVLLRHVALKEYMPANLACRPGPSQVRVRSQQYQEAFDQGMRSFINEARLLARFDHPSLVKAHRFWEANGTAYMVMPLYRGSTLKQTLKALQQPPSEAWLMALLDPLTEALLVLHAEGCFHRDIAPDNILLLEDDERPVLIDFGAARQVIGDLTHTLTAILKPGYAPVEQYADSPEMIQGPWTDVYALAATMHFAITGATPPTAVGRLMEDSHVPLGSRLAGVYSHRFLLALDRALQVKPRERTASMTELRADLGLAPIGERTVRVTRSLPEDHRPQNTDRAPLPGLAANPRKPPAVFSLAVLGAGVVGVAGAVWWWSGRGQEPPASPAARQASAPAQPQSPPPQSQSPSQSPVAAVLAPAPSAAPNSVAAALAGVDPSAFDIQAQFQNIVAAQTSGFDVHATATRPVLTIGKDLFGWRIRSAREGYVHILSLGADGTLMLVFPNRQDRNNRILAGQTLALPRDSWRLAAAEPPGQEELLVFVSAQPRGFDGLGKRHLNSFVQLPTGAAAASVQAGWPHATPWLLGVGSNCKGERCQDYGAATVTMEVRR
jgi:serine/threonine protein kinase